MRCMRTIVGIGENKISKDLYGNKWNSAVWREWKNTNKKDDFEAKDITENKLLNNISHQIYQRRNEKKLAYIRFNNKNKLSKS